MTCSLSYIDELSGRHLLAQRPVQKAEHHSVQAPQLPLDLAQATLAADCPVVAQLHAGTTQEPSGNQGNETVRPTAAPQCLN